VEVSAKKTATPAKSTASTPAPTKVAESMPAVEAKPASTTSSTHSSPELRAADILQQRQHRQREHDISVEEKHTTLNQIDAALDDLSHELDDIVAGRVENKKQILQTEENLTKAMFRIDSVESDGEVSVRHRRKELIKKSQTLFDVVDEFKTRGTTSDATPTISATAETEATPAVENDVEMTESAPEVAPETESTEVPAVETTVTTDSTEEEHEETEETEETELLDTLSDIESLPDAEADHTHDAADETTPAEANDTIVESSSTEAPASESGALEHENESEEESEQESDNEEDEAPVFDPLDLIIDAALDLARSSDAIDHDFELVSVH
ncbi:hypothetical protein BGX30_001707, partial [Mortierella sp. GBA39]